MVTESTPLLVDESHSARETIHRLQRRVVTPPPPTWEARPDSLSFFYLSTQTLKNHYLTLFATILSALACAHFNMASKSIFDPLVFKSVFVVFGFTIGFRNMRANERRGACLQSVRNICQASWELLLLLPHDDDRPRIRDQLLHALEALADHVMRVAGRSNYKYSLSCTEPCDKAGDTCGVRLGPTMLMAETLLAFEDQMSRMQKELSQHPEYGASQKYQRTFWAKKLRFDDEHYNLVNFAIPSVSDAYVVLINSSTFIFSLILPWGIHCNNVDIRGVNIMGAGTFLVLNAVTVMWVMLGLNTLAAQHEDPFMPSYEMIDLRQHIKLFRHAVVHYDTKLLELQSALDAEDLVAAHVRIIRAPFMSEHSIDNPAHNVCCHGAEHSPV